MTDMDKVREFMAALMKAQPHLPAILVAEKAMDKFEFEDGSDEAAGCYDMAFELGGMR